MQLNPNAVQDNTETEMSIADGSQFDSFVIPREEQSGGKKSSEDDSESENEDDDEDMRHRGRFRSERTSAPVRIPSSLPNADIPETLGKSTRFYLFCFTP